jgi:biopolymer transport protein ExbB
MFFDAEVGVGLWNRVRCGMEGLWNALVKGGWILVPIGICSLVSIAVVLERLYTLRRARIVPWRTVEEVKRELIRSRIGDALELCQKSWHPVSRILEAGILKHREPRAAIKEAMEDAGRQEVEILERHLDLLAFIANFTPLLGLLGTVLGLIRIFGVLHDVKNVGDPSVMAGGVAEALVNTAAGLAVAIPALFFHHHFQKRAQRFTLRMEKVALEVLEILVQIQQRPEAELHDMVDELSEL